MTGWANLVSTGKADVNVVENTTFFDFGGKALPVLDVYRYNRNSVALSRHKVNVMQRLGGTLGVSAAEAYYGDSVSVKISAANGYRLDSCRLSWAGLSVLLESSSSSITFEMPDSDVELTPFWSVVGNTGCGEVAAEADGLQVESEPEACGYVLPLEAGWLCMMQRAEWWRSLCCQSESRSLCRCRQAVMWLVAKSAGKIKRNIKKNHVFILSLICISVYCW